MKSLFDKTILKNLELKNRFIRSATWEGMAENGHVTDKLLNIYNNLSKGGCAAIITGYAYIHDDEQPTYCMLGASNDSYIDDFKRLTDTVHANDTKIILQLAYGGTQTKYNIDNRIIWGPSSLEHKQTKVMAKEMTKEELKLLAELFADAALRGKIGGFDGVQIHCAHGYLLSQFLSPYYNRRSDEYGGPIENKARILYEIISKVQEKVGVNFPVLVKINCSDFDNDEGLEFEEAKYVCKELAKIGIAGIEISGGIGYNPPETEVFRRKIFDDLSKQCYFREYASLIADEINIPVILVGGNRTPDLMNEILNTTNIQYFSMSRVLLCQPDMVNIWIKNPNEIPECKSCNRCFSKEGNICSLKRSKITTIT